jgi:hypothetical protein
MLIDLELVSVETGEGEAALSVTFDAIYPGETWVRSVVDVTRELAALFEADHRPPVSTARDALLELLQFEVRPVSFHLVLSSEGTEVVQRSEA